MFDIMVDLSEVKGIVHSDDFVNFLLNHSTGIGTAAFIISTIDDKLEEIKKEEEDNNEV